MLENIKKYSFIGIIILLIVIGIYLFIRGNNYKDELTQQILDNNKIGYELKLSENALMSVGYINKLKMDSVIAAGDKKVDSVIKANKENPLIVTKWKTNTVIEYVQIPTYPDKDSTFRIAEFTESNNWYYFKSKYQIVSPFSFTLEKLSLLDYWQLTTTKRPDNRIAVYISNKNPFVHIDSSETLIDPVLITQTKFLDRPETWKWSLDLMGNIKTKNNSWLDVIDLNGGIYSPMGIGVKIGASYIRSIERTDLKLGIGYLKSF